MEKIIFFGLVIPIFAFVLYLGVNAIMKGTEAKNALKEQDNLKNEENETTRKALLWTSIIVNLGFLGVFKYYNFFLLHLL